ncbi:hypothetical protein WJX74_008907 [Apatococcus lobatus]|uniref:Uncharacterized protein n=1 Tax=Apatococcus lobatus TaxID=904363 RepID=A0AAW1QUV5_9CHLO
MSTIAAQKQEEERQKRGSGTHWASVARLLLWSPQSLGCTFSNRSSVFMIVPAGNNGRTLTNGIEAL